MPWEHSSVEEHMTADRDVTGSILVVPIDWFLELVPSRLPSFQFW